MSFLDNLMSLSFTGPKRTAPTKDSGSRGSNVVGGQVQNNEMNPRLIGRKRFDTFQDAMLNVSIVGAAVRTYLNMVGNPGWKVEPAEDTDNEALAEEMAEFVEGLINDTHTSWSQIVRRSAMYRLLGYSVQEWTAKKLDDGNFGLFDVAPRPQRTIERWDLDPKSGIVNGCTQRHPVTQKECYLSRSRIVYLVDNSLDDSPEGSGLLRHVIADVDRLEAYGDLESVGFARDLRGIPVARIPYGEIEALVESQDMTRAQADAQIKAMEMFTEKARKNSTDLGLNLDSAVYETTGDSPRISPTRLWDMELLSGDGANLEAIGAAITRTTFDIARVLGVEHLMLGQDNGTQALSSDKSLNFSIMINDALREIANAYQRDLLKPLWELNGFDEEYMPTLKTDAVQTRTVAELTESIHELASSGATITANDPAVHEIYDLLGLSRPLEVLMVDMVDAAIPGPGDVDPDDPEGGKPPEGEEPAPQMPTQPKLQPVQVKPAEKTPPKTKGKKS